jgi:hypothetical protein
MQQLLHQVLLLLRVCSERCAIVVVSSAGLLHAWVSGQTACQANSSCRKELQDVQPTYCVQQN